MVNRYLRIEAYYQQAARTAGATVQSSLDATLKSSSVCNSIAGNSTAYGIMKSHYKSSVSSYNTSNFSDGLNLLAYRIQAKTYLYKEGQLCTNITGGWSYGRYGYADSYVTFESSRIYANCVSADGIWIYTKNKVNLSGYSSISLYAYGGAIYSSYRLSVDIVNNATDLNTEPVARASNPGGTYTNSVSFSLSNSYYVRTSQFSAVTYIYDIYLQ